MSLAAFVDFWILCLLQGAMVLLPGAPRSRVLDVLRARWWWLVAPAALVVGLTYIPSVAGALGPVLALVALVAVPPLAAVGLAWATPWSDRRLAPLALVPTAVLAVAPHGLPGDVAAAALVVSSCTALAVLVTAVVPRPIVKGGVVVWAAVDLLFALAHLLERASRAVIHATPAFVPEGIDVQLQRVAVGGASFEYADLFIAAVLGAVLAAEARRRAPAAGFVAGLAIAMSAFLIVTTTLPGTVPVAVSLALNELHRRRRPSAVWWRVRRSPRGAPHPDAPTASG